MKCDLTDKKMHLYFSDVLQVFHISIPEFMYELVNENPGAILLYVWIDQLFYKQKTVEETVVIITRNLVLRFFEKKRKRICNHVIII
ncbi:hypothetical protein [Aquimarina sp. SS2-1]|uniref:hypothetical protein n=1 Tax=Aquimarina besae TaxID=3342247 RepID=UPI0036719E60